jgi:hypothetical protein
MLGVSVAGAAMMDGKSTSSKVVEVKGVSDAAGEKAAESLLADREPDVICGQGRSGSW